MTRYLRVVYHQKRARIHIARECMSREELEKKIDTGIQPQDLANELYRRIAACPGIVLGNHTFQPDVQIKLPESIRDRHMYIIGKSGSGKTNLIRWCVMSDLKKDNGIGVIAPEQELYKRSCHISLRTVLMTWCTSIQRTPPHPFPLIRSTWQMAKILISKSMTTSPFLKGSWGNTGADG